MNNNTTTLGWFDSALSDHEGILALALRAGRVGLWSRNLLTDRADWSALAHEIFGTNPNTFDSSAQGVLSLIDTEDRDLVRQSIQDAILNHTELVVEFRIHPADGDVRWIWTQGHAVYDKEGKATQMVGVAADITERKRSETARSHLAAIVESSDDAIISKRLDQTIISWNEAAQRLFGYSAQEIIGQSIIKIIPPELQHEETAILARIRRGERIEHYETTRLTKDGRRIEVSISVSPVLDELGRVVGASKIARDIGALRAAQRAIAAELAARTTAEAALRETESKLRTALTDREQLLESERSARSEAERLGRMKDEFLATLSHELRTPLNAIKGWATLLKQPNLPEGDRGPGLDAIERNARAQAQIINDLLDMNRIVAGKFYLDVQAVHLHEVIHAAIEAVRPSAEAKRLRIRTILDSAVGATRGDPNRLQQVMWNLLTNAVKFTPAGGSIQIVLERVHSQVEITVQDTGSGISQEFLPYVFDRFRQADASTSRRHGGLGLGLSIVKNLVELHGGSVRVRSEGEGHGATFVVSLPVVAVEPTLIRTVASRSSDAQPEAPTMDLPRLDNLRILVVDDEPDGRALLARILHERGGIPVCTGNAQVALESLANNTFDLLLSDIGMPEMDGYELIRSVRASQAPTKSIPAIAVTAYARAEDRQRSLLAGYQMHISKPVETPELIAAIASLLQVWNPRKFL
jgi:PAS domain S-box-containing protein